MVWGIDLAACEALPENFERRLAATDRHEYEERKELLS